MKPATLITKLSTKTVFGKIDIVELKELKKPMPIMRIYGIAKRVIAGTTTFGDYIGFAGMFEAINKKTGEKFAAGKCYLPDCVANMLSAEFVKDIESIRFGFDIEVIFDDNVPCKYQYRSTPLIQPKEDNPIALLSGELAKQEKEAKPPAKK